MTGNSSVYSSMSIFRFDKDIDLRYEFEQKALHKAIDFKRQRAVLIEI